MHLQAFTMNELTPSIVASSFENQQCLILRQAINKDCARAAFAAFANLMQDKERLRCYPFDQFTRLGYTPPGIETLQRDSKNRDWNRAMFDFNLGLTLDEPAIADLYLEATQLCHHALTLLDDHIGTEFAKIPKGGHTLRTAQYLLSDQSKDDVLFPPHLDFSLLTVFIGSGTPGLEVKFDEQWHDPELEYGDVLIGIGTPMTKFPIDFSALWHRIVGGADRRLSSFLFYDLRDDIVLPSTGERYGDMLKRLLKTVRVEG